MMEAIRRLFGKRHKPIPESRAKLYSFSRPVASIMTIRKVNRALKEGSLDRFLEIINTPEIQDVLDIELDVMVAAQAELGKVRVWDETTKREAKFTVSVDVVLAIVEGLKAGEAMYELANKPRKRELRGPMYELGNKPRKRATKPVPVETPEEAEAKEVKRRMAEEERKRSNDEFMRGFDEMRTRKNPATLRATAYTVPDVTLEHAKRIIIAATRFQEPEGEIYREIQSAHNKERLEELRRRILADVRREAKEKEIGNLAQRTSSGNS